MSRFKPESYAEAVALRAEKPVKPRKQMSRGKGTQAGSGSLGRKGTLKTTSTAGGKKVKKAKRKKLPSIKSLHKRAWAQFSIWIRVREADENGYVQCTTCPSSHLWNSGLIHAGHWIHGRLDFDERNIHPQCRNDNFFTNTRVNTAYSCFMARTYGAEIMDELRLLSNTKSNKYSRDELNELIVKFKALNATSPLTTRENT